MAADEKWYFTKEQLANTPSRKCGIDADKELSYRQQAANFIQDMGQRLMVSQLCINTAIVYMHRFYVFHSLSQFHRNAIAAAALFLAAKVEEQPRKLEHVIKVAYMCLHREQTPPDTKSEQYLEQAQDLVFNENVLLQTLGFDVAIDHPHTHVVRCCQLVKASKDLAQTSYFMASNSLHLTTMCLQYKPTVVACFCIHLACKWSNWEIPQSNEGKHWFWYVDESVTSELLQQLTAEFLHIFDKCPSRLKRKIMSISANQSPNMNHTSLPNSPFDAEPRKVQSPAMSSDGGPTFQSNRPHHTEKQEDKKQSASMSGRPPVDVREYREKKERERIEREKAVASTTNVQGHSVDTNKHHSHHHKPVSGAAVPNKHPVPPGQKTTVHHNHHHRPEVKIGQPAVQRHSSSSQPREPNRDLNRQRMPREYNSNSGTSGGTMFSHGHSSHPSKDVALENSLADSSVNRSDSGVSQESMSHSNPQEKLSNNNHSVHRLNAVDCKHQPHDKRAYDPRHNKPSLEHRKDGEQKPYAKYSDQTRPERQRKPDTLEQRSEEVRKLIEKPLPPPKLRLENQKEEYIANMLKQPFHAKHSQQDKLLSNPTVVLNELKVPAIGQGAFVQEKSPNAPNSAVAQTPQKSALSKSISNQHSAHGVSQILKDTVKNGGSQSSLSNVEDPKAEKRPRHEDLERSSSSTHHNSLQVPSTKHRSLFSPEKSTTVRESHSQRPKSKQKTPPVAKVPKQERLPDHPSTSLNLVSQFASHAPVPQQNPSPSKRVPNDVTSTSSHKRHRTPSNGETDQSVKAKTDDMSSFEGMMLGRVPELIQPIRDNLTSTNGRNTTLGNDQKPPELRPFEIESIVTQITTALPQQQTSTAHQKPSTNGLDLNVIKQEPQEARVKQESLIKSDGIGLGIEYAHIKPDYLSPMKSAQSISALLQEPLASMPSLLQGLQQFGQAMQQQQQQQQQQQHQQQQQQQQQVHQDQMQQPQLSESLMLHEQQISAQSQCSSLPIIGEPPVVSTVDISALNMPIQGATEITTAPITVSLAASVLLAEEKKSEHHKSEKKKKKEKHKHKDKDKSKEKRKHKHKDKEKQRDKEKERTEDGVTTVPIKITIPKDKLNLNAEQSVTVANVVDPVVPVSVKTKSPQGTGLKIKIPKERLKGTEAVTSSPAQPVIQAPLKITIRTDAISRSGSSAIGEFLNENRKREREQNSSPTTSGPPNKKQTQASSYVQQRPGERQNGRHYNTSSNNKEKHTSSHHKSLSKLGQHHAT